MKASAFAVRVFTLALTLLLGACGSAPPAAHWQEDAAGLMKSYQADWLEGHDALARREFEQALKATAATGEPARMARLYLVQCGLRRAALDWGACGDYARWAGKTPDPAEAAYARFLQGDWAGLEGAPLPPRYAALAALAEAPAERVNAALAAMADPLSKLIAASVALKRGQGDARTLQLASAAAAQQGWRRPLLAWLKLRLAAAKGGKDTAEENMLLQRIQLVESSFSAKE